MEEHSSIVAASILEPGREYAQPNVDGPMTSWTTTTLGWTASNNSLHLYNFRVDPDDQPVFKLKPNYSSAHDIPSRVYLDDQAL